MVPFDSSIVSSCLSAANTWTFSVAADEKPFFPFLLPFFLFLLLSVDTSSSRLAWAFLALSPAEISLVIVFGNI
jgi:hypothetical protein